MDHSRSSHLKQADLQPSTLESTIAKSAVRTRLEQCIGTQSMSVQG